MIKTENLKEFIKLNIATAYLEGERSTSGLIIAKPESGKTESLREFSQNDGICFLADVTYTGLINLLQNPAIHTLLIPDMLKVYGRKASTSMNFFTLLNEIIEEGITELQTFDNSIKFPTPVRKNIIGAITEKELSDQLESWGQIGFLSRVIPFSFSYDLTTITKILNGIMHEEKFITEFENLRIKKKKIKISYRLAKILNQKIVVALKNEFKSLTELDIYGFRFQRNIQTLAKASALLDKRNEVSIKDVNKLIKMSKWMDYARKPL